MIENKEKEFHNEPIHVANVSLNVSLNDDHQMLKHQSLDTSTLSYQKHFCFLLKLKCNKLS